MVTFMAMKYQTLYLRECTIHARSASGSGDLTTLFQRNVSRGWSFDALSLFRDLRQCTRWTVGNGKHVSWAYCVFGFFLCQIPALGNAQIQLPSVLNLTYSDSALRPVPFPCSVTCDPPLPSLIPRCRPGPPPPRPISLAIRLIHHALLQLFSILLPAPMHPRVPLPGCRLRPPALASLQLPRCRHKLRPQNKVIRVQAQRALEVGSNVRKGGKNNAANCSLTKNASHNFRLKDGIVLRTIQ